MPEKDQFIFYYPPPNSRRVLSALAFLNSSPPIFLLTPPLPPIFNLAFVSCIPLKPPSLPNSKAPTCLICLDRTAAFDTVDCFLLLRSLYELGLCSSFSFPPSPIACSMSPLEEASSQLSLFIGVPQESTLGPDVLSEAYPWRITFNLTTFTITCMPVIPSSTSLFRNSPLPPISNF